MQNDLKDKLLHRSHSVIPVGLQLQLNESETKLLVLLGCENTCADPKDNEQGLKTRSAKWGCIQRQEEGEFEGNVGYMEGPVLGKIQEKKEGREERRMEREERREEK